MFKLFLDVGGDFHSKDDFGYTCLLYSVKSNSVPLFFYLIYLGASLDIVDSNNISIVHWAAYNDNEFLLKFFNKIQLDLHEKDKENFTPLMRAVINMSYKTAKYLSFLRPDLINLE